ncbi:MAG: hypothetical protein ACKVLI_02685 [Alphaproteobacteria bacterium]|jgi:hypothetical protein|tara:strand:+ start:2525 stop:2704 length:180 start_codon:yes stop_codon:yes gene_type:complete
MPDNNEIEEKKVEEKKVEEKKETKFKGAAPYQQNKKFSQKNYQKNFSNKPTTRGSARGR